MGVVGNFWARRPLDYGISAALIVTVVIIIHVIPVLPSHSLSYLLKSFVYIVPFFISVFFVFVFLRPLPYSFLYSAALLATTFLGLISFALLVDHQRVVVSDLYELMKPVWFFFVAVSSASIFYHGMIKSSVFYNFFVWLLVVSALYYFLEASVPFGFDVSEFYVRDKSILSGKGVFSFGVTYFAASVYLLLVSILGARLIIKPGLAVLPFFVMAIYLVLNTQSRSAALALVALFVLFLLFVVYNSFRSGRVFATGVLIVLLGLFLLSLPLLLPLLLQKIQTHFPYIYSGIVGQLGRFLSSGSAESGSLAVRLEQIYWALANNGMVIVGHGIGKGYAHLLESFYALYYYRYGVVGVVLYSFMWGGGAFASFRAYMLYLSVKDYTTASLCAGFALFIVVLPLVSFSSVITDHPHLYSLFYSVLGASFGLYFKSRRMLYENRARDIDLDSRSFI